MTRTSFLASLQLLVAQRGSFLTPGPDAETLQVIGKIDGLTQFERRRADCRSQTADSKPDRRRQFDALGVCDNQGPDRSQTVDSKDGEMSEWLKEHAWKANPESPTERYRHIAFHNEFKTSAHDVVGGVKE